MRRPRAEQGVMHVPPFARRVNALLAFALLASCLFPPAARAQDAPPLGLPTVTAPGGPAVTRQPRRNRRNRGQNTQRGTRTGQGSNRTGQRGQGAGRTRTNPNGGGGGNRLTNLVPGGALSSAPVFGGGKVYVASWNGRVYALDAATGAKKWAFQAGALFNASPAVGPDGTVYASSYDHNVYALDGNTGAKKWTFRAGALLNTAPALSPKGERVYVGGYDHVLYALNTATGKQVWQYKTAAAVCAPCVASDGTVYVGADRVYAVDGQTGKPLWATSADFGDAVSIALGADGTVYAPSHDAQGQDALNALNGRSGKVLWSTPLPVPPSAPPTAGSERVYVSAGALYCLRSGSGRVAWQFGGGQGGRPAESANAALVVTDDGDQTLHAQAPGDGSQRWAFSTSDPLLSNAAFGPDGNVYAACEGEGKVYCLNARNGSVVWTFKQDALPTTQKGRQDTRPAAPSKAP